jgi:hypothetical protein
LQTGNWSGFRDWLAARGIGLELVLTNDASLLARGGVDPGSRKRAASCNASWLSPSART